MTTHAWDPSEEGVRRIRQAVEAAGFSLQVTQYKRLSIYLSLIIRWNSKINLTSIRDPEEIIARHLVESIGCALALPSGIASLLDFGSGAGLPGIPVAICRPEVAVTLAESQGKKAAFLQEVLRSTGVGARVHHGRAEALSSSFDCVALRAVDHMQRAVAQARSLIGVCGYLAAMTSLPSLASVQTAAGEELVWEEPIRLPGGMERVLLVGRRCPTVKPDDGADVQPEPQQ